MDKYSILQLRKDLHSIAEPSMQEQKTKALLMDWLSQHTKLKLVDKGLWFYAEYKSKSNQIGADEAATDPDTQKKPIAFRADFDGVVCQDGQARHLCGHDGHSAILAAFATELEKIAPDRDVYLIFQPGEETGEGGRLCCELISEKGISEIYAFHNIPGQPENQILLLKNTFACASTGMELAFTGSPSHAAYPDQGKNPAEIIARLIQYAGELTRKPHRGIVLATVIGVDLGSRSYGVSAEKGVLRFTLRGEHQEEYNALVDRIKEKALALAAEEGILCEIKMIEEFPATVNHKASVEKLRSSAERLGLEISYPGEPFRWSEDFGYYLQKTQGAMFGLGAGLNHPGLHTAEYEFNDQLIETVIKLYTDLIHN